MQPFPLPWSAVPKTGYVKTFSNDFVGVPVRVSVRVCVLDVSERDSAKESESAHSTVASDLISIIATVTGVAASAILRSCALLWMALVNPTVE